MDIEVTRQEKLQKYQTKWRRFTSSITRTVCIAGLTVVWFEWAKTWESFTVLNLK